jgi:sec-independent protein translocase protein TatB
MFDIGFSELMVIGVVALLVLGPERLPGAARTLGSFVRKARQSWDSVRTEFERQIAVEDVKRSVRAVRESVEAAGTSGVASTPSSAATTAAAAAVVAPPGAAPAAEQAPHD